MSTGNGVVHNNGDTQVDLRPITNGSPSVPAKSPDSGLSAITGSRLESDLVVRERTPNGDPVAKKIAYSHAITGGLDLDEMQLASFLDEVEVRDPLLAKHLRSVQQDRVRPQFQRLQDVRIEVDASLEELRLRSAEIDQEIDEAVVQIIERRDRELALYKLLTDSSSDVLSKAHERAAELFAKAGASYDPQEPRDGSVTEIQRLTEADAATALKLPSGDGIMKSALLAKWISWMCTAVCGCVFGLSLGLASGLLQSQDVIVQPKFASVLTFAIIGTSLLLIGRGWIRLAWYQFSESFWLGQGRIRQLAWFFSSSISTIIVTTIVVTTDKQGILRAAMVESAWGQSGLTTPEFVFWIIAAATSFCLGYAVFEGLALGRDNPIKNVVLAYIEDDYRNRCDARSSEPTVQDALAALNRVRASQHKHERALRRMAEVRLPFDELIAKAEQKRVPYPLEHTESMKRRVQDPLHNLEGLQIEFDALVSDFLVDQAERDHSEPTARSRRRKK